MPEIIEIFRALNWPLLFSLMEINNGMDPRASMTANKVKVTVSK